MSGAMRGLLFWDGWTSQFRTRILILFWIFSVQGLSIWFLIHAVGLLVAWGGLGGGTYRRRYSRRDI